MATQWLVGSIQNITWSFTDVLSDVIIEISRDNGSSWSTIVANTPNTGTYLWVVPEPATTQGLIQIGGLIYTNPTDGSTIDFTDVTAVSEQFSIVSNIFKSLYGVPRAHIKAINGISAANIKYFKGLT
jgi:hypothetical protein